VITVHLPSDLGRTYGLSATVALGDVPTLGDVFRHLDGLAPGLLRSLTEADGAVRPHLAVFVAGQRLPRATAALALAPDAEVWVLRAVSGG
jgi:hypothetical protein